jgi:rRNA maturation endonuclease Nob1
MKHGIKAFLRAVNQPTESHYNRRRRCVVCGTKLSKNARFCKVCGTQVEFSPIQTIMTQAHEKRISFFCQLDNEKHPATHSAYQCEQCARHVCDSCYRDMIMVGLSDCSYCGGKLIQIL